MKSKQVNKFQVNKNGSLPNHWGIKKLHQVCDIFSGGTPSTKNPEYWNGDIPWLSSGETRNNFIFETDRKITKAGVKNSSTRLAKIHDVIVASAGQGNTRGQVSFCLIDTYINQSVIALRAKKDVLNPIFLFYNLKSRYNEFRRVSDSYSSRGSLPKSLLETLDISLPPLEVQERISTILYDLDYQVYYLIRLNQLLEKIIQSIFKSWFLDFDNHKKFDNSEVGKIPKNWKVKLVDNVCKTIYRYPTFYGFQKIQKGIPVVRTKHISDDGWLSDDFSNYYHISKEDSQKFPKTILELYDTVISVRGEYSGKPALVSKNHVGNQISPNCIRLSANKNKINHLYLYYSIKQDLFKKKLRSTISTSAIPGIKAKDIKEMKIIVPDVETQIKFENVVVPLIKKIENNKISIPHLEKIHDFILPELISGKII